MLSEEEKAHDLVARLYRSAFNLDASTREDAVRHAGMFRQAASELERLTRERDERDADAGRWAARADKAYVKLEAAEARLQEAEKAVRETPPSGEGGG